MHGLHQEGWLRASLCTHTHIRTQRKYSQLFKNIKQIRERAVNKKGGEVCISLPFCGAKLSDLTSDELNSKHLRVLCITDEGKNLPVREKKSDD